VIVATLAPDRLAFLAVRVSVEVDVVEEGENAPVTLEGSPLTLSETEPPKPFTGVIVTVKVVEPLPETEPAPGLTAIAKSGLGAAWTTSDALIVWVGVDPGYAPVTSKV
jgi:hypothetical protein